MPSNDQLYHRYQEEFYRFYEPLCQYAFTFLKEMNTCEDIVQDIFLHVWEKKKDLIGNEALRYYLYTAVRNNCLTSIQKSRKNPLTPLTGQEWIHDHKNQQNAEKVEADFSRLLEHALDRLPPKCREVFVLSRMSKLTYQQIADTLDISIKTVENQMGKALRILRAFLQEKEIFVSVLLISLIYGPL